MAGISHFRIFDTVGIGPVVGYPPKALNLESPGEKSYPNGLPFQGSKSEFRPWLTQAYAELDVHLTQLSRTLRNLGISVVG